MQSFTLKQLINDFTDLYNKAIADGNYPLAFNIKKTLYTIWQNTMEKSEDWGKRYLENMDWDNLSILLDHMECHEKDRKVIKKKLVSPTGFEPVLPP